MTHPLEIVGRSSSHFTRTVRIFAIELGVEHGFRPVLDLTSFDANNYAENPALKLPILVDEQGPLFGTENICRELTRRSGRREAVVLRGDVGSRIVENAEELTLHVMAADVSILIAKMLDAERPPARKPLRSIEGSLAHLDANIDAVLAALPPARQLSFLEAALFSVLEHLPFREVADVSGWARLGEFRRRFAERESANRTEYRFDV